MPGCELFLEYASGKVRLRNGFDKECVAEVTRGTRSASKKIQHVVCARVRQEGSPASGRRSTSRARAVRRVAAAPHSWRSRRRLGARSRLHPHRHRHHPWRPLQTRWRATKREERRRYAARCANVAGSGQRARLFLEMTRTHPAEKDRLTSPRASQFDGRARRTAPRPSRAAPSWPFVRPTSPLLSGASPPRSDQRLRAAESALLLGQRGRMAAPATPAGGAEGRVACMGWST